MEYAGMAVGGLAGILAGVAVGLRLGSWLKDGPLWRYWVANVLVFGLGVAIAYAGLYLDQAWLAAGGVGMLGGGVTGLKYGFGRTVRLPAGGRSSGGKAPGGE